MAASAWALDEVAAEEFVELLAPLFEACPPYLVRLASDRPYGSWEGLIAGAERLALSLPEDEAIELLDAHPRIGAPPGTVSALSFREQGYDREGGPTAAEVEAERLLVHAALDRLNAAYEARFGFRFVVFVAGRPRSAIVALMEVALQGERSAEMKRGLRDVVAIAADRAPKTGLRSAWPDAPDPAKGEATVRLETHYGKAAVSTYRTRATPLTGLTPIPESSVTGRPNVMLAAEIDVQVMGEAFTAAYTVGDNSSVVATDTMKNFIHRESLAFTGCTLEGWLFSLGRRFLETYPQAERLRVSAEELRFDAARVPAEGSSVAGGVGGFEDSAMLFHRRRDDRGVAEVSLGRDAGGRVVLTDLRAGRVGLDLLKVTGSSFAAFARDAYTTLPDRPDRLLYTHVDVAWRYLDPMVAVAPEPARYVLSDQVADLAASVFHGFVSLSIQHLVHEIGTRMLERFPALAEVSFEAQNRTLDEAETSADDPRLKVYTDPRPPYGRIGLTMRRETEG